MVHKLGEDLKDSLAKKDMRETVIEYLHREYLLEHSLQNIEKKLCFFQDKLNQMDFDNTSEYKGRIIKDISESNNRYKLLLTKDNHEQFYGSTSFTLDEILRCSIEGYEERAEVIGDIVSSLLLKSWINTQDEDDTQKKTTDLNLIEIPEIKFNIFNHAEIMLNQFQEIKLPDFSNIKRMLATVFEAFKDLQVMMEPVIENMKNITTSITEALSSIDFETWAKNMEEAEKRKLSYFLQYDWYFPIVLLEDLPIIFEFESVSDANDTVIEILKYYKDEHGYDFKDFIPKSLKSYKEFEQIEYLFKANMYKLVIMFCLERIENRIKQMQQNENASIKYSNLKVGKCGYKFYMNTLKEENIFLEDLVSKITIDQKVHLFDSFKEGMAYKFDQKEYPLNRNLFLHGFIEDYEVSEVMAKKAILAYGFFESLFLLKYKSKEKIRRVNGKSNRVSNMVSKKSLKRCGFSTI